MNLSVPVEQSLSLFRSGDCWWARPLVAALESRQPGRALRWTVTCVRSLLGEFDADRLTALDPDLSRLLQLNEQGTADPAELLRESEAIWYRPRGRDLWQTAVARLFAALAYRLRQQDDGSQREVASALAVVADHEQFTANHLDRAIRLYIGYWNSPHP